SGIQSICPNTSLTLFAGNGFTNYTWETPSGIEVGQSIETTLEGDYTVSAIGANSCLTEASTVTITFLQPEIIVINPSADTSLCMGSTITFTATSGLNNYIWNTPTGTFSGSSITASVAGDYSVSAIGSNTCLTNSNEVSVSFYTPQEISIISSEGTTICPGDSVELQATNGFTDYEWSSPSGISIGQTIFASQSGNYAVNATDINGCHSISESVLIDQGAIDNISITPNGTIQVCAGGSITLSAESGFVNYTWSNDEIGSNLLVTSPGVYYVTATGSICGAQSANVLVNFDEPGLLEVTADGSLILCSNDDVVLTAESGYTNYLWSNGQTGISQTFNNSASVQVTATDIDGCEVESDIQSITEDPTFSILITPSNEAILCTGSVLVLEAESGFTNYVWSNSSLGSTLDVTNAGLYLVSAQNGNGCYGTSNVVNVQEISAPVASFTYEQVVDVYTVNFTSGQIADTYFWDFGNNQTSTEVNPSFTFPFDAIYPVTLIITNSCGSDTITLDVVVIKTGINNLNAVDDLQIGPNPGDNKLVIKGNSVFSQQLEIKLYSISGQLINKRINLIKGSFLFELDMTDIASGVYMVQISDNESSVTRKCIKN
nr:T9SS type A sorting domain-containing protein [Flavobacteriales bacterium]